ncbi:MAG: P1 family peptidase [Christensenellales bacterium]
MSGSITDIKGITVGHYTDKKAKTGCTAVICQKGAVAGVDVRGSAPGTRETDLLRGYNSVERVQAIMLSGGSAYGLDAASGAMQYFEESPRRRGIGVFP